MFCHSHRNAFFLPIEVTQHGPRSLVVVEGPTDLAAALTLGVPAIGISSASHSAKDLLGLLHRFGTESVVLLLDSDKPGRRAAERIGAFIFPHVRVLRDVALPSDAKDVREWYVRFRVTREQLVKYIIATEPVQLEVLR